MAQHEPGQAWGGPLWAAADLLTPMAIRVAATLRLADHITAGTSTVAALASAVDADPDVLGRLCAHLVTAGVLVRDDAGRFGLTELGEALRDDAPDGVRATLDLTGAIGRAELCFVELLHTVRTGEPAYVARFGQSFWADLASDPALAGSFDHLMGTRIDAHAGDVARAYDWDALGELVDVGGGNGSLVIELLRMHGGLRATVLDLPGSAERARTAIASAGLADRAVAVGGSFFDPLPAGAGGYLLSGILHDWDDSDALRILRRCAEAAGRVGAVIVLDHIADGAGHDQHTSDTAGDLRMLCLANGRERTLEQVRELAAAAGLDVTAVHRAGIRSVLELRAATR